MHWSDMILYEQFEIYLRGFYDALQVLLSRTTRKHTFWDVRPTKTQIICASALSDQTSLPAWKKQTNLESLAIQNAPIEDSDQTARKAQSDLILRWTDMVGARFLTLLLTGASMNCFEVKQTNNLKFS